LCCALSAAQRQAPPLELAGKIALPALLGRIGHLAADFYHGYLFVAASGDGSVQVIDVRRNLVVATMRGLAEPSDLVYVAPSNRIFVTSSGDGTLRSYDGDSLKFIGSLHIGPDIGHIAFDGAHGRLYVGYRDALAVLDSVGQKLFDIPLPAHPDFFQVAEETPRIFINLPSSHSVAEVDSAEGRVMANWPIKLGSENFPLALDEAANRLFVVCRRPSRLLVLDVNSGSILAQMPAIIGTEELFYDPIHERLYGISDEGQVAIYGRKVGGEYAEIAEMATSAGARTGLFVPEWNRLFVAVPAFTGHPAEIRIYQPR
jgi:DNA-binding beta-propeller fold protein YncE